MTEKEMLRHFSVSIHNEIIQQNDVVDDPCSKQIQKRSYNTI